MRVFVIGQKWLGLETMRGLLADGHDITGVACPVWDRLYREADGLGVRWWWDNEDAARNPDAVPEGTDLIVAAHCFDFLRRDVRARAPLGAVGYHPSLLPRHPGRYAVQATISAGDAVAGGTVYRLRDKIDAGPILMQRRCAVLPGEDVAGLWRRALAPLGVTMLRDTVRALAGIQDAVS